MTNRFDSAMLNISKLSKLQKRILEEGLKAHWDAPIARAWGHGTPGCFDIRKILEEFFAASKEDIKKSYGWPRRGDQRGRLAKPRATISRAIFRLTKRGFSERIKPTGRGSWRLTAKGIKAALLVCSPLRKPTRIEMLPRIRQAYLERKTRLERAGQEMPITWKDFCAGCFLQAEKTKKKPGVKVDLDLTCL
jgi:hypothetical protein